MTITRTRLLEPRIRLRRPSPLRHRARAVLVAAALALVAVVSAPPSASALDPTDARRFVETVTEDMFSLLRVGSEPERPEGFRALIVEHAAVGDIARVIIGRPWRAMSEPQREDYTSALVDYVAFNYVRWFDDFSDQTIDVVAADDQGRRGVFVTSIVRSPGESTELVWRVTDRNGDIELLDIYVAGVSLIVTQQNDVSAMFEQAGGDFDRLIAELRSRAASARADAVSGG